MKNLAQNEIRRTIDLFEIIHNDSHFLQLLETTANQCIQALIAGKKILFAGNGGSAADAQHLAAELVSRLRYERQGLAAIALTTDTSILTAIGNDYGFEYIFSRQIEALSQEGDIVIGLSTSGKSLNILNALKTAQAKGLITIGLTGQSGGLMVPLCDYLLKVPSVDTQKIQECHILLGHILCGYIEERIIQKQDAAKQYAKNEAN